MAKGPVETANPQQYLRLLLIRLLETQKCLKPFIERPEMAVLRRQFQDNAYILSEIQSWLAGQDANSQLGPSSSSAQSAENPGLRLSEKPPSSEESPAGPPQTPFVWRTYRPTEPAGTSQVLSSLPSGCTLPATAKITNGQITFRPPFLNTKPKDTSNGGK